ncbi:GmrSD restriction endonuclease domain-containing protein [Actinosynnema sp. CA-248983]
METREIFDAAPFAVSQFLSETGLGLYIPPYQRNYSWDVSKTRRLVDDVAHGLNQLPEMSDSICFLGTVIALRDLEYITVEPIYRPQVPAKVMTIIDGQQRLTTLLVLTTILHEEVRVRAHRLNRNDPGAAWLKDQAIDVAARLQMCFEEDMRYGQESYRFYPRMIRAYYDAWSRNSSEAHYKSPIGHYLHHYGAICRSEGNPRAYTHEPLTAEESDESNAEAHRHLVRVRNDLRKIIRKLIKVQTDGEEEEEESRLPSSRVLIDSQIMQHALFNSELSEEVRIALLNPAFEPLTRLIVFANYFLQRVTVAVVTAKREEYGFEMFEALNTTGEPLTAIETFKPRAIRTEGLSDWKNSPSKKSFDLVDAFLDREGSSTADKRQSATSTLLTPFALAQSGEKLSKRLNDQRRYLRRAYDEEVDQEAARDFLQLLAQVGRFIDGPWRTQEGLPESNEARTAAISGLALAALREGNHDIVIAPLARYWASFRLASDNVYERGLQFLEVTQACVAFYALWRGAHSGTAGIDDIWRRAMSGDEDSGLCIARNNRHLTDVPEPELVKLYLRKQLQKEALWDRDAWTRRAAENPIYTISQPLTRLLLLAASHNSTPDDADPGLIVRGRPGLLDMMTLDRWRDQTTLTVEHIAPRINNDNDWKGELYEAPQTINLLGNLTLLPRVENASAGNRSWQLKRLIYRALSAATVDEADSLLAQARESGISLGEASEQVARSAHHLPLVAALSRYDQEWQVDIVKRRSERLAGLAWDTLHPLLE